MADVLHCSSVLLWNRRPLKLRAASLWQAVKDCVFRDRKHQGHIWVPHSSLDRVQLRQQWVPGNEFFIYYFLKIDICYLKTKGRRIFKKKKKKPWLFVLSTLPLWGTFSLDYLLNKVQCLLLIYMRINGEERMWKTLKADLMKQVLMIFRKPVIYHSQLCFTWHLEMQMSLEICSF